MTTLVKLLTLAPGTRFRTESGRTGTLIYASELRARVKWDADARRVRLEGAEFEAPGRAVDIASGTEVVQIGAPSTELSNGDA